MLLGGGHRMFSPRTSFWGVLLGGESCYWVAGAGLLLGGLVRDPWLTDKVEPGGACAKHRIWGLLVVYMQLGRL